MTERKRNIKYAQNEKLHNRVTTGLNAMYNTKYNNQWSNL